MEQEDLYFSSQRSNEDRRMPPNAGDMDGEVIITRSKRKTPEENKTDEANLEQKVKIQHNERQTPNFRSSPEYDQKIIIYEAGDYKPNLWVQNASKLDQAPMDNENRQISNPLPGSNQAYEMKTKESDKPIAEKHSKGYTDDNNSIDTYSKRPEEQLNVRFYENKHMLYSGESIEYILQNW